MGHGKTNSVETTPVRLPKEVFLSVVEFTPLVSLDFLIRDPAGRILLGYRRNRPAQGFWFVPGGRIGKNEIRDEAFSRLTMAELGVALELSRGRFLGVYEHLYPDNFAGDPGFGTHYVVLAYEIAVSPGELRLTGDDQHDRYAWMSEAEMLSRHDVHAYSRAYCGSLQH